MKQNHKIFESNSYSICCDPLILPWGNFFKEEFGRLYSVSTLSKNPLSIDIFMEEGLPVVKCYTDFTFRGLVNGNEGIISGTIAGDALTDFLLGHLHFVLKNSKDFTNMPLLARIEQKRGELEQFRNTTLSEAEAFEIYKFLD